MPPIRAPRKEKNWVVVARRTKIEHGGRRSSISLVEYLKKLVDLRVADDQINLSDEEEPFLRTYGRNLAVCYIFQKSLLRKEYQPSPPRTFGETLRTELNNIAHSLLTNAQETDVS